MGQPWAVAMQRQSNWLAVQFELGWGNKPMGMAWEMVPPGLPTKLPKASLNPVVSDWIFIICVTIWRMPVKSAPQSTPNRG